MMFLEKRSLAQSWIFRCVAVAVAVDVAVVVAAAVDVAVVVAVAVDVAVVVTVAVVIATDSAANKTWIFKVFTYYYYFFIFYWKFKMCLWLKERILPWPRVANLILISPLG